MDGTILNCSTYCQGSEPKIQHNGLSLLSVLGAFHESLFRAATTNVWRTGTKNVELLVLVFGLVDRENAEHVPAYPVWVPLLTGAFGATSRRHMF